MRKPDILCIGAQKAGTSWFYTVFGAHPDIWVPPFKEIHYFDHLYTEDSPRWSRHHIRRAVRDAIRWHVTNRPQIALDHVDYLCSLAREDMFTRRWYGRVWERAPAEKRPMDVTPEYSCISEEGVAHVKKMLGRAKVFYVLRDPAERAASQIRMGLTRRRTVPQTIDEWIAEIERPEIDNRGDYRAYVPRWRAAFGESQLKILPYGRIAAEPEAFLRDCEIFAELAPHTYPRAAERVHQGQGMRVPEEIKAILRERHAPQYAFLRDEFPAEFVAML